MTLNFDRARQRPSALRAGMRQHGAAKEDGFASAFAHLPTAAEQSQLIADGNVVGIYNPLMRQWCAVVCGDYARPVDDDEMVIATGAESAANSVEDLQPGCKIALTDNKDVKLRPAPARAC